MGTSRKSPPKNNKGVSTKSARRQKKSPASKKWSGRITKNSNALDLAAQVFELSDPRKIAASLKHSAENSKRKKGTPLQSALSMLNFYINRAGKNLSAMEKKKLEKAKPALRALFGKKQSD